MWSPSSIYITGSCLSMLISLRSMIKSPDINQWTKLLGSYLIKRKPDLKSCEETLMSFKFKTFLNLIAVAIIWLPFGYNCVISIPKQISKSTHTWNLQKSNCVCGVPFSKNNCTALSWCDLFHPWQRKCKLYLVTTPDIATSYCL